MSQLRYRKGNIFEAATQVIVNPVNCKGVMGAGLALAFKQHYPDMFNAYVQECQQGLLRVGHPTLYRLSQPWILNFPTKDHWRAPSKLAYIELGLQFFAAHYRDWDISSIAFPQLGTGHGKLTWKQVEPVMTHYLSPLEVDIFVYLPNEDISG